MAEEAETDEVAGKEEEDPEPKAQRKLPIQRRGGDIRQKKKERKEKSQRPKQNWVKMSDQKQQHRISVQKERAQLRL